MKNLIYALFATFLLAACTGKTGSTGAQGSPGLTGPQGSGSGVQVQSLSAGLTCPAGGVSITNFQDLNNNGLPDAEETVIAINYVCNGVNGTNGSNGANGSNGTNGSNTTFSIVPDSGSNCSNGGYDLTLTDSVHSSTQYICNGTNGTNGSNGTNGNAGTNGTNGSNGGTVTFDMVQAIEPCGAASSPWKEVILGLAGGQLLSDFSESASGTNTRLSFIPNGSYVDTDESGCNFSVSGDGVSTSAISWGAGSNAYSTWVAGGYSWTPAGGWVSL